MVRKKDGKYRLVIDFRELNSMVEKENWPIPKIDDLLFRMKDAKYFSKTDESNGYFQIKIGQGREYTGITDGEKKYVWNYMPQGLRNAPMIFSKIMNQILGDLEFTVVYIDDIVIFSKTAEEHLRHINIVMQRLRDANIKISLKKSEFFCKKIEILGHVISAEGIEVDRKKVDVILERKSM